MSLTKDGARQLLQLQEQDKAIDALQAAIDKIPLKINEIRGQMESRKSRLAETRSKSNASLLRKKEKESLLSEKEAGIKKHHQELNQVKTNEAFKALQTEIDKAKAEVGDLETEILTIMEELDALAAEEKRVASEIKESDAKAQGEIAALEKEKSELEARAQGERGKREGLFAGLPEDVLKRYEYLRKRKPDGVALAPLRKNLCGACRISLPPQMTVEVMKGSMVTCESCQRILYIPEAADKAASAAPPAA